LAKGGHETAGPLPLVNAKRRQQPPRKDQQNTNWKGVAETMRTTRNLAAPIPNTNGGGQRDTIWKESSKPCEPFDHCHAKHRSGRPGVKRKTPTVMKQGHLSMPWSPNFLPSGFEAERSRRSLDARLSFAASNQVSLHAPPSLCRKRQPAPADDGHLV